MKVDLDEVLDVIRKDHEEVDETPPEENQGVIIGSPEWTPYVLSLLTDKEKIEGYPKVAGLRRLVPLLLGDIVKSGAVDVKPMVLTRANCDILVCVVSYEITIVDDKGNVLVCGGVADAGEHNVIAPYNNYPSAIAETRAEGRALRKALQLDVVAAEELEENTSKAMPQNQPENDKYINHTQKNSINIMCMRLNINVINFIKETLGKSYDNFGLVEYEEAQVLLKKLTEYQRDKTTIPSGIVGFSERFE